MQPSHYTTRYASLTQKTYDFLKSLQSWYTTCLQEEEGSYLPKLMMELEHKIERMREKEDIDSKDYQLIVELYNLLKEHLQSQQMVIREQEKAVLNS